MKEAAEHDGLCGRALRDLEVRRAVFGACDEIEIPDDGIAFWSWYAEFIRCGRPYRLRPVPAHERYPEPANGPALWFSGGVESSYTRAILAERGIEPTLLDIDNYAVFEGLDRRIGQIHFLCAVVGASLGHAPVYLGMERADLLLGETAFSHGYVERHPLFTERWTAYQPEHRLETVCGHLHKEEVIAWLHERSIPITGTCDRLKNGQWCGECYKCFEAFYTAKAVHVDLGIPLTRPAYARYSAEYARYLDSGFVDNFNNAYQHYVRLQITEGLRFEPELDCVEGPSCDL